MKAWRWIQPGNRVWKVISDYESGVILVFDEHGNLILKREGLTKVAIQMVEQNFLDIVCNNNETDLINDPMFA